MHRFREPVNGFTHLIGVPLGFAGLLWLISLTHEQPDKMLSMIVYGVSIMLLYAASAMFHLVKGSDQLVLILRRIDHAAIYVLIAGTYTPLVYNILSGTWRWGVLGVIWGLALIGIVYKLLFLRGNRNHISLVTYILMGWIGILVIPHALPLIEGRVLVFILAGGLAYTIGAVIFALGRPNFHIYFGHHEIWHLFVLAGTTFHFAAVLACI
jgi:hemolysin III